MQPKTRIKTYYIFRHEKFISLCKVKFLPASGFKWIDPKEFNLNKYTSNSSKNCVLEFDLEYPKELPDLHSGFPLAPDKIEIKGEMLSEYQLKIADLYNIPICNIKISE